MGMLETRCSCDAEVGHLHRRPFQQEVLGLEVEMDQLKSLVRVGERLTDLKPHFDRRSGRQWEMAGERASAAELLRAEPHPVVDTDLVDVHEVRMPEESPDPRFAPETHPTVEDLQRDRLPEPPGSGEHGLVHLALPPFSKEPYGLVSSDSHPSPG
jgi:hypothetical protein